MNKELVGRSTAYTSLLRAPEPNARVPLGYYGPNSSIVDLYAKVRKGEKVKSTQVYGQRKSRKWVVS